MNSDIYQVRVIASGGKYPRYLGTLLMVAAFIVFVSDGLLVLVVAFAAVILLSSDLIYRIARLFPVGQVSIVGRSVQIETKSVVRQFPISQLFNNHEQVLSKRLRSSTDRLVAFFGRNEKPVIFVFDTANDRQRFVAAARASQSEKTSSSASSSTEPRKQSRDSVTAFTPDQMPVQPIQEETFGSGARFVVLIAATVVLYLIYRQFFV